MNDAATNVVAAGSSAPILPGAAQPLEDEGTSPGHPTVRLVVVSEPEGAEITLAHQAICRTPCDMVFPRSQSVELLSAHLPGYREVTRSVSMSEDVLIPIVLARTDTLSVSVAASDGLSLSDSASLGHGQHARNAGDESGNGDRSNRRHSVTNSDLRPNWVIPFDF
jgi:hypothetical protein